ncbi:HAMP domain-containing histidine kinase [Nonomuraea glycinis]|uniref:sensor histidine kinase n=1 Tax=Nonomuraea glycinis TaxID=2047744 RepID=UPI00166497A0|nr:HAMP domain-containing sensor histidine kinase [Nonomuraea glycinis]MCA2176316.1 HAMP domain-containing histidine kinase [Nonomuraea glycinis]
MNRRVGRSLRVRLALFASIAMLLLSIVVNAIVMYSVHNQTVEAQAHQVFGKAVPVLLTIKRGRLTEVLDVRDLDGVQVVDPSGRVTAATPNLAGLPRLTKAIPLPGQANGVAEFCDLPGLPGECHLVIAMSAYQPDGAWLIYALAPDVPWYVSLQVLAFQLGVTTILIMLAWFGVSRVVAQTLAPVNSITRHLAEITADGGGMRMAVPENLDDEIRTLAETANQTLERLETAMAKQDAAMEQQRRFAGDASHDLRSPITAMRTQVEEAMLHPEQADWPATAAALMASLDRLQAIVTDLLTLTKLDTGAPAVHEPVNLGELVATETRRPSTKRIVTRVQIGVIVTGDRLRLARLVTNLLDNAERHAESQITVTVRQQDDRAVLEVLDDGAGIAPDQWETVFQRFTRLDASRNIDAGGTGLGLTIAREIAESHGGTLTIEPSDRGARFVLRMPPAER